MVSRTEDLFEEARKISSDAERAAFLEERCGEDRQLLDGVRSLLQHDNSVAVRGLDSLAADFNTRTPKTIGPYDILKTLGVGGMGIVYLARQPIEDPSSPERSGSERSGSERSGPETSNSRRLVALKVAQCGNLSPDAIRRFQWEVEALRRLKHPGIAEIYDADTFESGGKAEPYFVMEFVEGVTVLEYVRAHKLGLRARLELFCKICDSIHHAHLNGVIHRDLKPENILVEASGQSKILDFGVAKSTRTNPDGSHARTRTGQLIGTLAYMSPEQSAGLNIDARSDVYSLGVILYEALVGRLPYGINTANPVQLLLAIRENPPTPPRSFDSSLSKDIDAILQKTLCKERKRRYQSALSLREDIERYLQRRPVDARKPNRLYALSRFARRNWLALSICVVICLFVGFALALNAARVTAERRLEESEAVLNALTKVIANANPYDSGGSENVTQREVLENAHRFLQEIEAPLHRAQIQDQLGHALMRLGSLDSAEEYLDDALATFREHSGPTHPQTILSAIRRADLERLRENHREASARIAEIKTHISSDTPDSVHADVLFVEGLIASDVGDPSLAGALFSEVVEIRSENPGPDPYLLMEARGQLARAKEAQGNLEDALTIYEKLVGPMSDHLGPDHVRALTVRQGYASALAQTGDHEEAERELRDVLTIASRKLRAGHPVRVRTINELAIHLDNRGRLDEAEALYLEILRLLEHEPTQSESMRYTIELNLAHIHMASEKWASAENLLKSAINGFGEKYGQGHPNVLDAQHSLVRVYAGTARIQDALELCEQTAEVSRKTRGQDHVRTLNIENSLGEMLRIVGRTNEALEVLERTFARLSNHPLEIRLKAECGSNYAKCLATLGSYAKAEDIEREVLEFYIQLAGPSSLDAVRSAVNLALTIYDQERFQESAELTLSTIDTIVDSGNTQHSYYAEALFVHGLALERLVRVPDDLLTYLKARRFARQTYVAGAPGRENIEQQVHEFLATAKGSDAYTSNPCILSVLHMASGSWKEARSALAPLLESAGENDDELRVPIAYLFAGLCEFKLGEFSSAHASFQDACELFEGFETLTPPVIDYLDALSEIEVSESPESILPLDQTLEIFLELL